MVLKLVFETAIIKFKAKKCNLILIGLYRPPTANTDESFLKLDDLLQTFSTVKKKNKIIGMGDSNINILIKDEPTYVKLQTIAKNNIKSWMFHPQESLLQQRQALTAATQIWKLPHWT